MNRYLREAIFMWGSVLVFFVAPVLALYVAGLLQSEGGWGVVLGFTWGFAAAFLGIAIEDLTRA